MTEAFTQFLDSLKSPGRDWAANFAVSKLDELKGAELKQATDLLLSILSVDDPRAAHALGRIGGPRVCEALRERLAVATGEMRVATAGALLEWEKNDQAIEAVVEGLADPDLSVARAALNAALPLKDDAIEPLLEAAAQHPRDTVRCGAAYRALYLGGVDDSPNSWDHRDTVVGLADEEQSVRQQAFDTLCGLLGRSLKIQVK